MISLSRTWR